MAKHRPVLLLSLLATFSAIALALHARARVAGRRQAERGFCWLDRFERNKSDPLVIVFSVIKRYQNLQFTQIVQKEKTLFHSRGDSMKPIMEQKSPSFVKPSCMHRVFSSASASSDRSSPWSSSRPDTGLEVSHPGAVNVRCNADVTLFFQ